MVFPVVGGTQDTSYEIENSLRPGGGDNHHLSMVYSSAASDANRRKFTFSGWIKLGQAAHYSTSYDNDRYLLASTDASASTTSIGYGYTAADFHLYDGRSGTYIYTTSKFRDPSAWYHLVVKYDSTQSTASDRIFIYVNGVSQTLAYSNSGDPEVDLNTAVDFFSAGDNVDATSADSGNFVHNVNGYMNSGFGAAAGGFDGYFADWYLLDGQALAPTEFAKTDANGVWVPKKYTGTFNSHSFHLEFKQTGSSANSSGIGADTSGQDNHFKVGVNSTLAAVDITTDTPTNNFCTVNPLGGANSSAKWTFSEGNTQIQQNDNGSWRATGSTMAVSKGKWYWEVEFDAGDMSEIFVGVHDSEVSLEGTNRWVNGSTLFYNHTGGEVRQDGTNTNNDYGTLTAGDILGVALNMDDNQITFYDNGSAIVSNFSLSSYITGFAMPTFLSDSNDIVYKVNFGNAPFSISSGNSDGNGYGNFEYSVPSGYFALCTKNLAEYG